MSTRKAFIIALLVVGAPLALLLLFTRATSTHVRIATPAPWPSGASWMDTFGDDALARHPHVSQRTVAAHVAERAGVIVDQVAAEDGRTHVRVIRNGVSPEIFRALHERLANGRTTIDPDSNPPPPAERPADQTWVVLRWQEVTETRRAWWPTQILRGKLVAEVTGPRGTGKVSAELDEKPWLGKAPDVFGRFNYIVAESPSAESNIANAKRAASDVAVARLVPLLHARVEQAGGSTSGASVQAIQRYARSAVESRRVVLDQCAMRIDRPFGPPVWYAAELIDAGPPALDALAQDVVVDVARDRRSVASMIGAVAGMVAVLAAVYGVLNALTRGYFRGHLRAAAVVALLIAVAVILLLLA